MILCRFAGLPEAYTPTGRVVGADLELGTLLLRGQREDLGKPVAGSPAGGGGERGVIVLTQQAAAGIEEVHEPGVVGGRGSLDGALQRDEAIPDEARGFDRPAGLGGSL